MAEFGYAGEILKVDLSSGSINKLPTADYADRFLGGRGIADKLYWDMVPPEAGALEPENCLVCTTGPVAGFTGFAGCRWQICGKSPSTDPELFSYANLGERWGILLKYAGYDGLAVQGKSDKPAYLYIHDNAVEIKDASHLWGKSAFETGYSLKAELGKGVSILTIGPAAENLISFATLLTDEGASGSGGLGSVMGAKKLKAIAVAGDKRLRAAEPERLRKLADHISGMRPTSFPKFPWILPGRTRGKACYGCGIGCTRQSYTDADGRRYKLYCQPVDVYTIPAEKYYGGWNEVILHCVRLCDQYGLDTCVMQPMVDWLGRCYDEGILREEQTGLPLSRIGSVEFIETLTRKITYREGFGDLLARGIIKTAESIGGRAKELTSRSVLTSASESRDYDPRVILHNALLIATEPRRPISQIHEAAVMLMRWLGSRNIKESGFDTPELLRNIALRFWGTAAAADYTTYEGKALASKKIQDRTHAKESIILCDLFWPIMHAETTVDHVGDPTLESQICSAVTGRELDEEGLNRIGERIFNLQRAILLRQGWGGRKGDRLLDYLHEEPVSNVYFDPECLVPDRNGEVASRKGEVVKRDEFEKMKSEYYQLRGWDVETGLPTRSSLEELQLGDIAGDLQRRGLLE